jgi:hypothetical protein
VIPAQAGIESLLHTGSKMKKLLALVGLLFALPALAWAQSADRPYRGQGYVFLGFGFGEIPGYNGPIPYFNYPISFQNMRQLGFGGEGFLYKGLGAGAEASHASWGGGYSTAWIGSGDFSYHFRRHAARFGVDPFVLGGVSIVGPTQVGGGRGSFAQNYGGGANLWLAQHAALRLEFRDVVGANFWRFSHVMSFRVGATFR